MQINPDLFQEVTQLADLLRAKFSPTEFIPGCLVKSVADKSQYATNNGWIEAVCGQHNQQRVRWKSNETVAVNDFVDVLYFPDRRLFEAYGLGGAGAISGGANAWPKAGQNLLEAVNYSTATLLIAAMSAGNIGYLGARSSSEAVTVNKAVTLRGVGAAATIFTTTFTITSVATIQDVKASHSAVANARGFEVSNNATLIDCIGIADSTGTSARGLNVTGSAQVTVKSGYYEGQNGTAVDVFADASASVFLDGPTLFSGTFGGSGTILGWYLDTAGGSHFVYRTGGVDEDISFNNGNLAFGSGTAITGLQASQAETDAGTDAARILTPLTLRTTPHGIIKVKNTSGVTVTDGMMGYITYIAGAGQEFRLTIVSSVLYSATACYVVTGGANNADIYVVTRGRFNLTYSGSAPAIGNYLIFSSTAGAVVAQTFMSPEVIAIAQATGAAGLVDALLICGTEPVVITSANDIYANGAALSDSDFISTIATLPGGAVLTYGAVTTGVAANIVPLATTQLAKMVLHNTTRSTSALISNVVTGTSTITLTANVPAGWATTDAITIRSQTNTITPSGAARFIDFEIVSEIPALTRYLMVSVILQDTGGVGETLWLHPYEANVTSKRTSVRTQGTALLSLWVNPMPLINNKFCMAWDTTGAGTGSNLFLRLAGQGVAVP